MNKKHGLSFLLTLLFLLFVMTTVNAADYNESNPVDTISQDYSSNVINKETIINQDSRIQKEIKDNSQTIFDSENDETSNEKIIEKNSQTSEDAKSAAKSTLTLGSTSKLNVGDKVNIYGKLTANGNNIANAKIMVTVDGSLYELTTTKYGNYNTNVKISTSGNFVITATYAGSNLYTSATNQTFVNVNKKATLLTLGSTKSVLVGEKVNVYGKLTANGQNVANAKITIYADGQTYTLWTSKYGNYNTNITMTSAGNKIINATYAGSDINAYSSNKTIVTVNNKYTLLTLGSTKNVFVGDKVNIYGKLTANGNNLANAKVTVTVDGKSYILTTSQYGNYNTNINVTSSGNKTITATYTGSGKILSASNRTYVNVNTKSSLLTLGSTKNVFVGDKVNVYGKLTANGKNVAYGKVTVTVDGKSYILTTSQYGNYNTNITMSSSGYKTITATYAGSGAYPSASNRTYVNVNTKSSLLTLGSTKNVFVGDKVNVYGKLTANGKNVAYGKVTVTVDGKSYILTTSQYGNYNTNIAMSSSGYKTITATYDGSGAYPSASNRTYVNVATKNTILTIGSTKSAYVGDKVNVYGKLTANGKNVAYGKVTLSVDGKSYILTTSQYGNYNTNITINSAGYKTITAKYAGSGSYLGASNQTYVTINKKDTALTVGCTSTVDVGTPISVYGKLTSRDICLAYKDITIEIGDFEYYTSTDQYGNYNLKIDYVLDIGKSDLYAYYDGNYIYKDSSAYTSFTVKEPSGTLIIDIVEYDDYYSFEPYPKYVGDDVFYSWYQTFNTYDWYDGVYVVVENDYDPDYLPDRMITSAKFYFIDDDGYIISRDYDEGDGLWMGHDLVSGYTPFKVLIKYRTMTQYEKNLWEEGYEWNPSDGEWYYYDDY